MATTDLASILTAMGQRIAPTITNQINRTSVVLRVIRIKPGRGKNAAWDVDADGTYVENHADGADVGGYGADATYQASLPWSRTRANIAMTDEAIAAAQTNGDEAFIDYLRGRMERAIPALASSLNADVFAGTGSGANKMVGLATALSDTGTYAGLSRSTYAWWRSNVVDGAGDPLTLSMIRRVITVTIYRASGVKPDFAFVPPEIYEYIGSLFQQQRRYPDPVRQVMGARGLVTLDASVDAIVIDGCTFISDKDATEGEITFMNSDAVEMEQLNLTPAAGVLAENTGEMGGSDGVTPIPLNFKVVELARTGDARKFSLMVRPCLKVLRPNACGRLTNFTMPS